MTKVEGNMLTELEKLEMELEEADPFEYWLKNEGFGKLGGKEMLEAEENKLKFYKEVKIRLAKNKGYEMYIAEFEKYKNSNGHQEFLWSSVRKDKEIKVDAENDDFRNYTIKLILDNKKRLDKNEILRFVVDAGEKVMKEYNPDFWK